LHKTGLSRRRLLIGSVGLIGLSASATGAYAGAIESSDLLVTCYALTPPNWPAGQKLTIAVIADLHAGGPHMTLPHIAHIVDTTNALHCDVVVLLGDFKASYKFNFMPVDDPLWAGELGRLRAPLGVWAILGNHDWWHDLHGVRSALANARIPVLENDAVLLGPPGQKFWLAGIGDQLAHWIGRGRFRGVDDLPGTLARVHMTRSCSWCTSPTFLRKCRGASRSRSRVTPMADRSACRSSGRNSCRRTTVRAFLTATSSKTIGT
jgi:hypothetical protein